MLELIRNTDVRGRGLLVLLVTLAGLAWFTAPAGAGQVEWLTGADEIPALAPAELGAELVELAAGTESRHVVVQFEAPISDANRAEAEQAGLTLLSYVGNHAYFAQLDAETLHSNTLAARLSISGIAPIKRAWKLQPEVARHEVPDWAIIDQTTTEELTVAIYAVFHRDVDLEATAIPVAQEHGAWVRGTLEAINGLVLELPLSALDRFADEDAVQWVEWPLPLMTPINAENRARTQADLAQAPPYNLDGSGVVVMVYDGGTGRSTHVDFQGRLTVHDSSGMDTHPTHVAGTIGGAGVANSTYKGMAPGVTLLAYGLEQVGGLQEGFLYTDPCDLQADYNNAINTYGAVISNNSIGTNTAPNNFPCEWEGNYGATSQLIDTIVRGDGSSMMFDEPYRIIWANGNERNYPARCGSTYHTTAPPACAKNHITVGALVAGDDSMTDFSSWGPTDDNRLKPDVSAPGASVTSCSDASDTAYTTMGGTSMASPTVTGCAALIIEDYRAQFPGADDPRNSTLKVLFAHTAVDGGNTGPDYQYGYGSIRVKDAIDHMRTENFLEDEVSQSETFTILATVGAGEQFKATLAWDDYPATPNANPTLVNDLDLRVFNPSGTRAYPWTLGGLANPSAPAVRTAEDHVNNIEQVLVNPADATWEAGTWMIEVRGNSVPQGPQPFSLTVSPQLISCSSAGTIALNSSKYACSDVASIRVIDCDLNTSNSTIQTVDVTIDSDSEPGGETVTLTETGPETAEFTGSIFLSETNSPGVLMVAHGNTVTATYIDADDGAGGYNVVLTDEADVDCAGPVISNVHVGDLGIGTATIDFNTNEAAQGTIRYGFSCGSLGQSKTESGYPTAHAIALTGLANSSTYFYVVDAEDEGGNSSTDDNGGACYTFDTLDTPDNCEDAEELCPGYYSDSTSGMTNDGSSSCGSSSSSPDRWYKYTPETSGTLVLDLCDSSYDTVVSVHTGCPGGTGNEIGCHDDSGFFGPCGFWPTDQSYLEISVSAYQTYYVRISGKSGDSGTYVLNVSGPDCAQGETCSDGIQNQGEDRIDCGGPCPPCECTSDAACANGTYCDGVETCDAWGECQAGTDVDCNDHVGCTMDFCNETLDRCDNIPNSGYCDNDKYCDGAEVCDPVLDCVDGEYPCDVDEWCDEVNDVCVECAICDFDCDGDVDLTDYMFLAGCLSGPDEGVPGGCANADLDGNGDIDLEDFATFQEMFTGN